MMSKETMLMEAKQKGYRPEILEKVYFMLEVLEQITNTPYLKERVVLKGGTALNLFCFETMPRLSVDIDLNYIGSADRTVMLEEKPVLQGLLNDICRQKGYELDRNPGRHAGGKMIWRYPSAFGNKGNLEVDLNFMYRVPLYQVEWKKPPATLNKNILVPVLDVHELAAGKLSALFSRVASRDIFDAHYLFTKCSLEQEKLRTAFVSYLAISDTPIEKVSVEAIQHDINDIKNMLYPVLQQTELPTKRPDVSAWANNLQSELHQALHGFLPLRDNEIEFVKLVREFGQVKPGLITNDENLWPKIESHPGILWAMKRDKEIKVASKSNANPVTQRKHR
ncbi:TPA: nucleotidyl transferase AbiEii/AbiGii toxin family protein [Legionella pneumophila]